MRSKIISVIAVVASGLLLGALSAGGAVEADHSARHLWFAIPTETDANNARLTTSWHGVENPDVSLDWDNINTTTTYSRAWGQSFGSYAVGAYGWWFTDFAYYNCEYVVWLDIYDWNSGTWEGSVGHVHTWNPQFSQIDYYFANWIAWNGGTPVAEMITFSDTCSWTGSHVHETHIAGAASPARNSYGFPTGLHWNTDGNKWTREIAW